MKSILAAVRYAVARLGETVTLLADGFDPVHGDIGVPHQGIQIGTVVRIETDLR